MFARFTRAWSLMGASWQVLKADKEILVFPFFSAICCLLVLASFALPIFFSGILQAPRDHAPNLPTYVYYVVTFLFYFCNYFVIVFFNSAMVACAAERMKGGNPTVGTGFSAALSRIHLIAGWALVAATVGLILRLIEERSEKVGRFVAGLLGTAWTVVTFLVVPVIVVEGKGPFGALKESTVLLKKTWGEQIVSNASFGLVFFVLSLPGIVLIILGFISASSPILITCLVLAVLYLMLLSLIHTALQAIFQTALYLYARDGEAPAAFQSDALSGALG